MQDVIVYIGLVQSLFTISLLVTRKRILISDWIMVACLVMIALRFLIPSLAYNKIIVDVPDFSVFFMPLLFGPFLYLYTTYHIKGNSIFNKWDFLHFAPFVIIFSIYIFFLRREIEFDEVHYFERDPYLWVRILFGLIFFSSTLIYSMLTISRIREFKKETLMDSGDLASRLKLNWLVFISFLFISLFVIYISVGLYNAVTFTRNINLSLLSVIGLTLLVYSVSYYCIQQPAYIRQPDREGDRGNNRNIKSIFTEEQAQALIDKLHNCFQNEKPYLDQNLSLQDLSAKINLSKYELTYLLNKHMSINFSSFVNEYRLNEAVSMLSDKKNDHLTIMSIAYDCGFNSKSTFNSLFKQRTGMTPSKFKAQQSIGKKV